jgi:hypothetical protein
VEAPAEMTAGSVDGDWMVLVVPASPVDTTTVMRAWTAASSNCLRASAEVSGIGTPPNDSFSTLTGWTTVA